MYSFLSRPGFPGIFVLSCLLSLFGILLALAFRTQDRLLAMLAMIISTLGDTVLMNFRSLPQKLPFPYFYLGAGLFILAHLVYLIAFDSVLARKGLSLVNAGFWMGIALAAAAAFFLAVLFLRTNRAVPALMIAVCALYLVIITANCAVICSYAFSVKSWQSLAALGAVSFFLSDYIIGLEKLMLLSTPALQKWVWILYPIGQFFILLGA